MRYFMMIFCLSMTGCYVTHKGIPRNEEMVAYVTDTLVAWNDVMENEGQTQWIVPPTDDCWFWVMNATYLFPETQEEFYSLTGTCSPAYHERCPVDNVPNNIVGFAFVSGRVIVAPWDEYDGGPGGLTIWECSIYHEVLHLITYCMNYTDGNHSSTFWPKIMLDHFGCYSI